MDTVLRQFQAHDDKFESVEYQILEEERPPMLEIPAYKEIRAALMKSKAKRTGNKQVRKSKA